MTTTDQQNGAHHHNEINVEAGEKTVITMTAGQGLVLSSNAVEVQGMTMDKSGALVVQFSDGASVTVKNFADMATCAEGCSLTLPSGQQVALADLYHTLAPQGEEQVADNSATAQVKESFSALQTDKVASGADIHLIGKPNAGENLVVKLQPGDAYKFGFEMTEPTSVKDNHGELVISFKNGGEIIIPNYDNVKDSSMPDFVMKDGTKLAVTDFSDVLSTAAQLNAVEPAAGGNNGGGGSGGGFGFNSILTTVPLAGINYIGPIDPTQLQYRAEFREPKPIIEEEPLLAPTISAVNIVVKEDSTPAHPSVPFNVGHTNVTNTLNVTADMTHPHAGDVMTVTIAGIPAGWTVDTSHSGGTYDAATGIWTLTLAPGVTHFSGGPDVFPPANSDVDLGTLSVSATVDRGGVTTSATTTETVDTDAVVDPVTVHGTSTSGDEGHSIPVTINIGASADADGSEHVTQIIVTLVNHGGGASDATLNHGLNLGNGVWSLTPADLAGLTINGGAHFHGQIDINVAVTETETNLSGNELELGDNSAITTDNFSVVINNTIDKPTLHVEDAFVKEDNTVTLHADAVLNNPGPDDHLVVTFSGFPAGCTVSESGGHYDAATNTWTITLAPGQEFHGGPDVTPPADSDVDLTGITVTATAVDGTDPSVTSSNTGTETVFVDAVIDAPEIHSTDASGNENTPIALNITVGPGGDHTDGSEVLSPITISGVPAGATLNHGVHNPDGTWTLSQADLTGLTITPPNHFDGQITLTASVTDTETNLSGSETDTSDNSATVSTTIHVTVNDTIDPPTLHTPDVWVKEDHSVGLDIHATLNNPGPNDHLTITVTGITPGWGVDTSVSGGTYDPATGTWTITLPNGSDFNGGPTLTPPADSDVDLTGLTVTATTSDGTTSSTTTTHENVFVDAVIDAPTITSPDASGNEDTAIPLTINVSSGGDHDGSEVLSPITITGVPAGATLNHGTQNPDGSWTLSQGDLTGLTITPPHNYSGNFTLSVSVTDTETNLSGAENDLSDNSATATTPLHVHVEAVADAPTLVVHDEWVKEDHSVQLHIEANLTDTDGSEKLTITVTGIAAGWGVDTSASGGTYNAATGTWTLTLAPGVNFNGGPTLTPPANSDADLTGLHVTATSTEVSNGSSASTDATVNVFTDAVVDPITVTASAATGHNNTDIPLTINIGASADHDGSEGVTKIVISGVPAGASLNHGHNNGDGTWTLTQGDLTGLTYHAASTSSGTVHLTVSVTEQETNLSGAENDLTDNTYVATTGLNIGVTCDPNPPTLCVNDVWVKEDHSVQLNVQAALDHPQSAGEHLVITITGFQPGWTVNTTTSGGTYDAASGTWTISLAPGASFNGGPTVTPPANSDIDLTGLHVTAVATDGTYSATTNGTENVFVDAVVDAITVSATAASGHNNTDIPLNITIGASADHDGSEGVTKIVISGVPTGASLNHGHNNGDGTWTLTQADLTGLTYHAASTSSGNVQLTVAVTEQETNLHGAENDFTDNTYVATTKVNIGVTCDPNPPTLCVNDVWVKEDHSVQLNVQAALDHPQSAAEHLVITITGFQPGWTVDTSVSGGTYNAATGTWSITLPNGASFNGGPTVTPPANSDIDLTGLHVTAVATDGTYSATTNGTENVFVDAVVDAITVSATAASGHNNTDIPLNITIGASADHDGSEGVTKIVISGVPAGASLNHGVHNADGTWTLTPADLTGLTYHAASTSSGNVQLTVAVTEQETNLHGLENDLSDNTYVATTKVNIGVTCDPNPPTLCVNDVWVKEDHSVQLNVQAALDHPQSASEHLVITITGFQPGWTVNTTTSGGTYDAASGTWTITLPNGASFNGGPTVTPPANSDIDLTGLHVTAVATDGTYSATTNGTENVFVDAVVDAITVSASAAGGHTHTDIPLTITIGASADHDGSEGVTKIVISGVPTGASLNHGHNNGDGTWTLTQADLTGLTFHPADNSASNVQLTVSVTEQETNLHGLENDLTDNTYVATTKVNIGVTCDPNPPTLCVNDVWVKEDHSVKLDVQATLNAPAPNEHLVVTITGFQPGWTVDTSTSGGTYNAATGTWSITLPNGVNFNGGPTVTPPADSDIDLTGLHVTATQTDGTYSSTTNGLENVFVDAVVDPITVSAHDTSGREGTPIALSITVGASHDTDGSETVTKVVISGVPAGGTLNHGTLQTNGDWLLTKADLTGLTMTPPATYMGNVDLTIKVTEQENHLGGSENDYSDNTYVATTHLGVDVYCDPHPPTLCVFDVWVKEDKSVALNVQATLDHPHPGEHLVVTISGFQPGWTVDTSTSGGTYDAAHGTWTITLPNGVNFSGGPTVYPPHDSDVDMTNLHVVATATDGVASASTIGVENVFVDAVVDAPVLTVPANVNYLWIINQSNPSPLAVESHVTDTDGSEKVTKIVINLDNPFSNPSGGYYNLHDAGVYLNKGTETAPGIWTINVNNGDTSTALNGLALMTSTSQDYYWALHNGPHSGNITVQSYVSEVNLHGLENDYSDNNAVVTQNICYTFSVSPLIIDLNGDGFNLVDQSAGVRFDMTNDGLTDATSWVGANDGLLAIDANHDGVINNQSELFGDNANSPDGFANLAGYDSNHDGVINASDAAFKDLLVWTDTNQNGVSDAGELHSLSDVGIASIGLTTTSVNQVIGDSAITTVSTVTYADGHTGKAGDAWFNVADAADHQGAVNNGTAENDVIYGTAKNDTMSGGDGYNYLFGGDGDDILVANGGVNELTGGRGGDTFLIHAGHDVDTIKDFNIDQGDKLDISDVLTNFDPLTSSLHNFVNVVQSGNNSLVQIDQTGTGHAFQTVVVLEGVHIDIDALTSHGNLIA